MEHTKGKLFASGMSIVSMPSQTKISNLIGGNSYEECIANAERIVLTWNSHDDLVKRNKELLEALEAMMRMRDAQLKGRVVPNEPELSVVMFAAQAINNNKS